MTLELGKKKYAVEGVPVRALAEMDEAWDMYRKLVKAAGGGQIENESFSAIIGALAKWLVVLFGGQFTVDEVLDHYPSDRFIADVGLMLQAVAGRLTEALGDFPMKARLPEESKKKSRYRSVPGVRLPKVQVRRKPAAHRFVR